MKIEETIREVRGPLLTLIACSLLTLTVVLSYYFSWCYPSFDLGIYGQAAFRMSLSNLNPFDTFIGLHILNDHTDPILWLVAPITRLLDPGFALILVEWLFCIAAALVIHRTARSTPGMRTGWAWALPLIFFVNPGVMTAVHFPSHPGAWAVFPLALLLHELTRERWVRAAAAYAFLCLFKEEFYFIGLLLGPAMLARSIRRPRERQAIIGGLLMIALSSLWLGYHFVLRPRWLGDLPGGARDYSEGAMAMILAPASLIRRILEQQALLKYLLEMAVPLAPLAIGSAFRLKGPNFWAVLVLAELVAIRLLYGVNPGFQYGAPVSVALVFLFLGQRMKPLPMAAVLLALLVAVGGFASGMRASVKRLVGPVSPTMARAYCPPDPERIAGLNALKTRILSDCEAAPGTLLFVQSNLGPRIVDSPCSLRNYNCGEIEKAYLKGEPFGVAWEADGMGDPWPQRSFGEMFSCLSKLVGRRSDVRSIRAGSAELLWIGR